MNDVLTKSKQQLWAEFRFSVIGPLLSSPPNKGNLRYELISLSQKFWKHPTIDGKQLLISYSSIERWYYVALRHKNSPIDALRKKARSDLGKIRVLDDVTKKTLLDLYEEYRHWSYQLHRDNLAAVLKKENISVPSYSTVRRYLLSQGKNRIAIHRSKDREGYKKSWNIRQHFECRSYENQYANGLWHLDFHHCSRPVVTSKGEIVYPVALAILDDFSRLICHLQWYLSESTENLVHGFNQALLKRNMPRKLLTDNGSAMTSAEFKQGLIRLSIVQDTTLPYSPHQNGKQEIFWGQLEGRLMAMLTEQPNITLKQLNDLSLIWVERDYNHGIHKEIKMTPYQRFIKGEDVARQCLSLEDLQKKFTKDEIRKLRSTDCTISLSGKRFEIPYQYRHHKKVVIRYASWDMSSVYLIDEQSDKELTKIYPLDKAFNAAAGRKSCTPEVLESLEPKKEKPLPPLLQKLIEEHQNSGAITPYLPKED